MAPSPKMGPQDMPPPGGYAQIPIERVRLRKIITAPLAIGLFVFSQFFAFHLYGLTWRKMKNKDIELQSARFALLPLILAERDRAYLKQVRKNRDEERELMKNDPEWEVGTYYGEPIYITRPEGEFREQEFNEFYAHSWSESISERMFRRHRC